MPKKNDFLNIETNLSELSSEANQLFQLLDQHSSIIKELEQKLNNSAIFFPFSYCVKNGEKSLPKPILDRHKALCAFDLDGYQVCVNWYLSWEQAIEDNKPTKYRLYLKALEKEYVCYNTYSDNVNHKEIDSTVVFKKPLIECSLELRLEYSKELDWFLLKLKNYLRDSRLSIEAGASLPF